jgi:WD40 repeat protein
MRTSRSATKVGDRLSIFISYSRRDAVAVDAIVKALNERGFDVKIDTRDLPFGEKWQAELAEFIRLCDTVIWLVSESSIGSKWVNWELDEVARRNKRLVPVMIADTSRSTLPRQLGEIHILPAEGTFELSRDLEALVRVLETDLQWLKEASRLQDRAHEWLSSSRGAALVLRGAALAAAENWKDRRPTKAPAPAKETLDLLLASRRAATKRQRRWTLGLLTAAATMVVAGLFYVQNISAERSRAEANEARAVAERDIAQQNESRLLTNIANDLMDKGAVTDGLLVALEGLPDERFGRRRPEVLTNVLALQRAMSLPREVRVIQDLPISHDTVRVADGMAFVIDQETLALQALNITTGEQLWRRETAGNEFVVAGDARVVLAAHWERKGVQVYEAKTGRALAIEKNGRLRAIDASGRRVVLGGDEKSAASIWDVDTGRFIADLRGALDIGAAAFSRDGKLVAAAVVGSKVGIWRTADGVRVAELKGGHNRQVATISFSPDGQRLLTTAGLSRYGGDNAAKIWTVDGALVADLVIGEPATNATWSPTGEHVAVIFKNGKIGIWRAYDPETKAHANDFTNANIAEGHTNLVYTIEFRADGKQFLTASYDRTSRVWDTDGRQIAILGGLGDGLAQATYANGDAQVVTASFDKTLRIWNLYAAANVVGYKPSEMVMATAFSPDGRRVAVGLAGGKANIVDTASGQPTHIFDADTMVSLSATFLGDGRLLSINGRGRGLRVWSGDDGRHIEDIGPDNDQSPSAISPSGRWSTHAVSKDVIQFNRSAAPEAPRRMKAYNVRLPGELRAAEINATDDRSLVRSGDYVYLLELGDQTARSITRFTGPNVWSARFSRDGSRVIIEEGKTLDIYDARTGERQRSVTIEDSQYSLVGMTSDGGAVLITSRNYGSERSRPADWYHRARVVDLATGSDLLSIKRQVNISHAATSGNGSRVVLAGDNRIDGFDVTSGKQVFHKRIDGINHLAVDASGDRVLLASDGKLQIWTPFANTQAMIDHAKKAAGRCLSISQRKDHYLSPDPPSWCVMGATGSADDPASWRGLPPYDTKEWRERLTASRRTN